MKGMLISATVAILGATAAQAGCNGYGCSYSNVYGYGYGAPAYVTHTHPHTHRATVACPSGTVLRYTSYGPKCAAVVYSQPQVVISGHGYGHSYGGGHGGHHDVSGLIIWDR